MSKQKTDTASATSAGAALSLEDQLRRLQEIASLLDEGELPLEEQLRLYEEGITLANTCRDYLTNAELRIQHLSGGNTP